MPCIRGTARGRCAFEGTGRAHALPYVRKRPAARARCWARLKRRSMRHSDFSPNGPQGTRGRCPRDTRRRHTATIWSSDEQRSCCNCVLRSGAQRRSAAGKPLLLVGMERWRLGWQARVPRGAAGAWCLDAAEAEVIWGCAENDGGRGAVLPPTARRSGGAKPRGPVAG